MDNKYTVRWRTKSILLADKPENVEKPTKTNITKNDINNIPKNINNIYIIYLQILIHQ